VEWIWDPIDSTPYESIWSSRKRDTSQRNSSVLPEKIDAEKIDAAKIRELRMET
jgi:hypothetical protein